MQHFSWQFGLNVHIYFNPLHCNMFTIGGKTFIIGILWNPKLVN
jgi:hypothetical protein